MLSKFKSWPTRKKIGFILFTIIFLAAFGISGYLFGARGAAPVVEQEKSDLITKENLTPVVANIPSPINGILYTEQEAQVWQNLLPIGVIIENHTSARPQSGINAAEVVHETLAEGGITRWLVVFLAKDSEVGPVRSNRTYFLDWVSEYNAGYAHVGGSPESQGLVRSYGIKDLDQFFIGAPTYQRVNFRFAPHNVYTTIGKLREAASARGYAGPVEIGPWSFTPAQAQLGQRPDSSFLELGFLGTFGYDVRWVYHKESNGYLRFNAGSPHVDPVDNKQILAKTLVVQKVNISADPSGHGRIRQQTIGEGTALVFRDGKVFEGIWKKGSRESRTRFYDNQGAEIKFSRGQIWVEVVPSNSPVSYQ